MSYQVLARKWRPQNFKQMVGQEHVLKALIHALDSQRLHHAYLFTGTRGVGKTTIGRILAKCLSCDTGITSEPCGTCNACTSIAEGRYVDLIEIDAASRTKVEDMRELLDNVQYAPSSGRFKIYLIDEVHMLSSSSFNALLKTLEEPPEHVKFLFATTDPQKLPVTILSRCLQFNLKNMSPERIVGHLEFILAQESVTFEEPALWALARAADGSMRDALSLTDQAIAYGNHELTEVSVSAMLGTVDQKKIYRIMDKLVNRDAAAMLAEVKSLAEFSPDYTSVLATLAAILHRIAVEQVVPGATDNAMGDKEQVVAYARQLCAEDVQLFYQIALVSRQDLAISPDPKSGLEMALLRMMAFQLSPVQGEKSAPGAQSTEASELETPKITNTEPAPQTEIPGADVERGTDDTSVIEPIRSAEEQASTARVPPIESEGPPVDSYENEAATALETSHVEGNKNSYEELASERADQETKKKTVLAESSVTQAGSDTFDSYKADPVISPAQDNIALQSEVEETPAPELSVSEIAEPNGNASALIDNSVSEQQVDNRPVDESSWSIRAAKLGLTGMTLNLLLNSVLEETEQGLSVYFESGHFRLLNASHESRIKAAIVESYGKEKEITFIGNLKPEHETPIMWRERKRAEMQVQAKKKIKADPNVQQILQVFDGVLIENSIQAMGEIN